MAGQGFKGPIVDFWASILMPWAEIIGRERKATKVVSIR